MTVPLRRPTSQLSAGPALSRAGSAALAAWLSPGRAVAACCHALGSSPAGEAVSGESVRALSWLLGPEVPPEPFPPPMCCCLLRCWASPAALTLTVTSVRKLDTSVGAYNLPGPPSHPVTQPHLRPCDLLPAVLARLLGLQGGGQAPGPHTQKPEAREPPGSEREPILPTPMLVQLELSPPGG